jgi:hypothetical protein
VNEHNTGSDTRFLSDAVSQLRASGSDLSAQMSKSGQFGFAPQTEPSADLGAAVALFRDSASRTLGSIRGGTEEVVDAALDRLKQVDKSKVAEAIDNLGKSFEVVQAAGTLIKQGLEKLKAVIASLSKLFGDDRLSEIKSKVKEIWEKYSQGDSLVSVLIGIPEAKARVDAFAEKPGSQIPELDGVSRELALLEDGYQGKRKILSGLESAAVLAMGLVGFLQVAGLWVVAPWVSLVAGGVYAAIIGSAMLVGMNYTGARWWAGWIRGVCAIVPGPQVAKAV